LNSSVDVKVKYNIFSPIDILICHCSPIGKIDFDDLFFDKRPYSPLDSYKQSKLANVLFSKELAQRLKGKIQLKFLV